MLMNITTASSGLANFTLTPALDVRLNLMASSFQSYRFTWLKLTAFPGSGVVNSATEYDWVCAFTPQEVDSVGSGSTTTSVMEMPYAMYISVNTTTNHIMVIPRSGLMGRNAYRWFDTNSSGPSLFFNQGVFLFEYANASVANIRCQLEFTIEFTNPIPSNVTLVRLAAIPEVRAFFSAGSGDPKFGTLDRQPEGGFERSRLKELGSPPSRDKEVATMTSSPPPVLTSHAADDLHEGECVQQSSSESPQLRPVILACSNAGLHFFPAGPK
jgi:hypothetical protein